MKKYLLFVLALLILPFALTACDDDSSSADQQEEKVAAAPVTEEAPAPTEQAVESIPAESDTEEAAEEKAPETAAEPATQETAQEDTPAAETPRTAPPVSSPNKIRLVGVVAYATAEGQKNGAAFMMIRNQMAVADRLTSVSTDIAESAELHSSSMENGAMKMRKVDGIDIPADAFVLLNPAGYHVMLLGLKEPLKEDESFPLTLVFEKAGTINTNVRVRKPGAGTTETPAP